MDGGLKEKGITLIELVMVIVIVGILAGVSSMYIKETIDLWRFLTFRNEIVNQGRMALARITREIRQIKDSASIQVASDAQLQFDDVNNNNINYSLSGNNLMRNSDILVSNITNPIIFTYYDYDSIELTKPVSDTSQIYRINIELEIKSGDQTKTLKSQIFPRNL